MKVGVDLRQLVLAASGGISQLVQGVCEHMFAAYPQHQFLVFCTVFNRSLLRYEAAHVRYFSLPIAGYFAELDRIAAAERLDALFRAYPMEDTLRYPLGRQIVLIPDIQHESHPEFFTAEVLSSRRAAFSRVLRSAGAIGAISEYSRATLVAFPDTLCRDIFLMPPALQDDHRRASLQALTPAERSLIPEGDYFLYPANIWRHKNHERLLEAFRMYRDRMGGGASLVLTGHRAGWEELARRFADLPVAHLGFVRAELLRALLERACALTFFSLYEGFGIPLLEAFDAGTPVICSNTTSLPEVGGNAILTCDPTDVPGMASLMQRIVSSPDLRASLVRLGRERVKAYSWDASAANLVRACERVAGLGSPRERIETDGPAMPLVSIVTPSFNQGRFLARTIDSVLAQGYPHIEYVVIDGGSTDESRDVLRSYGERVKWISEPDRGQSHAINKGMARLKGEILAYLNSDDVLLPGAIETVVRHFRRRPDCDMVYGTADYIDEDDRVTGAYANDEYSFDRLMADCMICQPAAFWRRRIADRVGPFDEALHYVMDYDYWQRIALAGGKIQFIPDKLASSRRYAETKTLSAKAAVHREIFEVCRRNAGRTHLNYFFGYWHHLMHDRDDLRARFLRRLPLTYIDLGWLHHRWFHGKLYFARELGEYLAGELRKRAAGTYQRCRTALGAQPPKVDTIAPQGKVRGFFADSWLGPEVEVPPREGRPGLHLHLAGTAPVNSTMTLLVGNAEVRKLPLAAGVPQRVSIPFEFDGPRSLRIVFSDSIVDAVNRRLAFHLHDTNIFSEQDTW